MGTTENNKTLSIVLKALGIIMTLGCILALIVASTTQWVIPRYNGSIHWFALVLLVGLNLWLLGALYRRSYNLNDKGKRSLGYQASFLIIFILVCLVEVFWANPVIASLDLSLSEITSGLLGALLGTGIGLYLRSKNRELSE